MFGGSFPPPFGKEKERVEEVGSDARGFVRRFEHDRFRARAVACLDKGI